MLDQPAPAPPATAPQQTMIVVVDTSPINCKNRSMISKTILEFSGWHNKPIGLLCVSLPHLTPGIGDNTLGFSAPPPMLQYVRSRFLPYLRTQVLHSEPAQFLIQTWLT